MNLTFSDPKYKALQGIKFSMWKTKLFLIKRFKDFYNKRYLTLEEIQFKQKKGFWASYYPKLNTKYHGYLVVLIREH